MLFCSGCRVVLVGVFLSCTMFVFHAQGSNAAQHGEDDYELVGIIAITVEQPAVAGTTWIPRVSMTPDQKAAIVHIEYTW